MPILDRFRNVWNAFVNPDVVRGVQDYSATAVYANSSPSRPARRYSNERSIISSIYTRLSIDVSDLVIKHIILDDKGRYAKDAESALNDCLLFEPNLDQGPRAFRQDVALTMFDIGHAAIVPTDTTQNPETSETFDVLSMRVGRVCNWGPKHVKVNVYNENRGAHQEITLAKRYIAIVENPLAYIMNEPNSTLQRLIRKLALLDTVDEQSSSGKLDIIIQLPYVIKSEARRQQAISRREDIEFQLKGSQYGIAYIDGTEKITQLNRPAENNLLKQIEYLRTELYNQLGLTDTVMNGTADEATMLNYYNRTVEPVADAIIQGMQRAFLGAKRYHLNERVVYLRDPFKLVPLAQLAEIVDKFTRNEILSSNEIRSFMRIPPSDDPKADQLVNSNMPQADTGAAPAEAQADVEEDDDDFVNSALDDLDKELDQVFSDLGGG